ncbi:menaquinone biosynthesis decarboxylase [Helicobacter cetorum]|uniref:menaquinone biosynthesis decarboxylase n=1 Tax=Helicobacter cetorum TaxID=138563 RepID=UPI000CF0354A|nr:menaquinone biosynthesis decarboxylase [Helicobacter cetorum]
MRDFLELLKEHDELEIIDTPLDVELEIAHLAYIEAKKPNGGKALLFNHPIKKDNNQTKVFEMPVLMNAFGSFKRLELLLKTPIESLQQRMQAFLHFNAPKNLAESLKALKDLWTLRHIFPKKTTRPRNLIIKQDEEVNLFDLPILKTWEKDGGAFITMGQVYTQSLDNKKKNLGMYRLQVYDKNHLGLHWQIHKDSQLFFHEYAKAKVKMPVSIAIGGDLLYTWCATAPLPYGIYELMLYGFIREKKAQVMPCLSNPLSVPKDCDIVIEGFVDCEKLELEGPFGDHTGYYTPIEPYPILEVKTISYKKDAIYLATVVGKPPLEDKYMGYLTERLFLPLLKTNTPSLIDYYMPENGAFHNLILAQISTHYNAHAKQIMHAFWGVGQMSFVKHAIFVNIDAPNLRDTNAIIEYILKNFSTQKVLISQGVCDALDHASPEYAMGGKLGIDATTKSNTPYPTLLNDDSLLRLLQDKMPNIILLKQYYTHTNNPICVVSVEKKDKSIIELSKNLLGFEEYLRIVIFVEHASNDLNNPYMLLWRVANNIDAQRDILISKHCFFIDATNKGVMDKHFREWPLETDCSLEVIENLKNKGLLKDFENLNQKFHLTHSFSTHKEELC